MDLRTIKGHDVSYKNASQIVFLVKSIDRAQKRVLNRTQKYFDNNSRLKNQDIPSNNRAEFHFIDVSLI